ncbi:MAG: NADH-quinone oxidoreductase subunit C [Phycisphaerae bacterium]|nr:NADH-quinone oxidoreductase subunit C [Phycisphaerae bacterium]
MKTEFPDAVAEINVAGAHPHVVVSAEAWPRVARFLRDDRRMGFDWLRCISGVDLLEQDQLAAVFDLHATEPPRDRLGLWRERHEFAVIVKVPRNNPHVPSVADVWPAADWHEREAYDLMGIVFDNHPDSVEGPDGPHPRRILCPDDWEGHALRKDYEFPLEYHGIPCVTEYGQVRPTH